MDYCMMKCIPKKLEYPEEIIKAPWIRPEDIHKYERIGINSFKISNRVGPSSIGRNCLKAYTERKCENLATLLTPLSLEIEEPKSSRLENFDQLEWDQMVRIWGIKSPQVYIDNNKLNGFIDFFEENKCYYQCGADCNYCAEASKKAVSINNSNGELDDYLRMIDQLIQPIISLPRQNSKPINYLEIIWENEVKELFGRLMQYTPDIFRDVATKTISKMAEDRAKSRNSSCVQREDMVVAFLEGTPEFFKNVMLNGLEKEGVEVAEYQK